MNSIYTVHLVPGWDRTYVSLVGRFREGIVEDVAQLVDSLKENCPGRSLVLSMRDLGRSGPHELSVLQSTIQARVGKDVTVRIWEKVGPDPRRFSPFPEPGKAGRPDPVSHNRSWRAAETGPRPGAE